MGRYPADVIASNSSSFTNSSLVGAPLGGGGRLGGELRDGGAQGPGQAGEARDGDVAPSGLHLGQEALREPDALGQVLPGELAGLPALAHPAPDGLEQGVGGIGAHDRQYTAGLWTARQYSAMFLRLAPHGAPRPSPLRPMATTQEEPATDVLFPFQTHPDAYLHWKLSIEGKVARLSLEVQEEEGPEYLLKQNSYDLSVDVELSDAIERLRFEHPEVCVLVLESAIPRVFCAGANIYMLGRSSHAFKVNFCKFTNETRLALEDLARHSGVRTLAALNGTAAGGGYELALACDEIYLVDDGNSAVSFPEVPLLAVLPGTGGLTRLVDKRKIRRDRADVFCTVAEGMKGSRAKKWGLVDDVVPRSKWDERLSGRIDELAGAGADPGWGGIQLPAVEPEAVEEEGRLVALNFEHVTLALDHDEHTATLTLRGPAADEATEPDAMVARGAAFWPLAAFRELDRALLHLRFDLPGINLVSVRSEGDLEALLRVDAALDEHREHGFVREVLLSMARTLRRFDLTAKSLFALIEPGSIFGGSLFELALACDRAYMLIDDDDANRIALSALNFGSFPMTHEKSRLAVRFLAEPETVEALRPRIGETLDGEEAEEAGLVTMAMDDLDYEDEVRLAIEERASLSPDALTGMEASLRFPGAENCDSKIFGRLSSWQNWIFQRPNAVGPKGALTSYGQPTRPEFTYERT